MASRTNRIVTTCTPWLHSFFWWFFLTCAVARLERSADRPGTGGGRRPAVPRQRAKRRSRGPCRRGLSAGPRTRRSSRCQRERGHHVDGDQSERKGCEYAAERLGAVAAENDSSDSQRHDDFAQIDHDRVGQQEQKAQRDADDGEEDKQAGHGDQAEGDDANERAFPGGLADVAHGAAGEAREDGDERDARHERAQVEIGL